MLDAAFIIWQTFRISFPTVVQAAAGRLTRDKVDERLKRWSGILLRKCRLQLEVHGADKVDWTKTYIIMSNHQSHLDIPVVVAIVPGSVRMVAKKELFRVPIWGQAMLDAGMISIDRGNTKSAIRSLKIAADTIHSGVNVWIAPEGTRSQNGTLGPLKKGGFVLAQETKTAIVPVVIDGTREALPIGGINVKRDVRVKVTFGAPIGVENTDRDALVGVVKQFFERHLQRE